MTGNPYQGIIDWLRSAEGCRWSEKRLARARGKNVGVVTYDYLNSSSPLWVSGMFSIKDG
jgi:hypothetical protein